MKNRIIFILFRVGIFLPLIFIYCLLFGTNKIFLWIIYSFTLVVFICFVLFRKDLVKIGKNYFLDRYISLISLGIALLAFIQTGIRYNASNEQFEKNRIASDSIFQTQLNHSKELNQLLLKNSQNLNDSLKNELSIIQDINSKQNLSAENQLIATQKQIELSKQSLQDYLFNTRAKLSYDPSIIQVIDTINEKLIKVKINRNIKNIGEREATKIKMYDFIVYHDIKIKEMAIDSYVKEMLPKSSIFSNFIPTIDISKSSDFYYVTRVKYYDEKIDLFFEDTYYLHYYKFGNILNFYRAPAEDKIKLRKVINSELKKRGLELIEN